MICSRRVLNAPPDRTGRQARSRSRMLPADRGPMTASASIRRPAARAPSPKLHGQPPAGQRSDWPGSPLGRVVGLDGIRGLAALVVVLNHIFERAWRRGYPRQPARLWGRRMNYGRPTVHRARPRFCTVAAPWPGAVRGGGLKPDATYGCTGGGVRIPARRTGPRSRFSLVMTYVLLQPGWPVLHQGVRRGVRLASCRTPSQGAPNQGVPVYRHRGPALRPAAADLLLLVRAAMKCPRRWWPSWLPSS